MFIAVVGATASGKSRLSVELAKSIGGEIVGADSMQIYRGMNIGTAKVTRKEAQGIIHRMIDIVEPDTEYSVAQYAEAARKAIEEIEKNGKVPIVCGGTGLYVNALVYDYSMSSYVPELRAELNQELEAYGIDYMYEKLLSLDPLAISIHKNNSKRIIRALEAIIGDGVSILAKDDKKSTRPHLMYAIDVDRELLYRSIECRVDEMFDSGLADEVDYLVKQRRLNFDMQSMQAIGYREFKGFYDGDATLSEVKNLIKQHTRNYAKRQLTWFKRIETCKWLKFGNISHNIEIIEQDYYNNIANLK